MNKILQIIALFIFANAACHAELVDDVKYDKINIKILPYMEDAGNGDSPNKKDWFMPVNPEYIHVNMGLLIANIKEIELIDKLAFTECKKYPRTPLIARYKYSNHIISNELDIYIKTPCLKYFKKHGRCPQVAELEVQVTTLNGKKIISSKKIYTCIMGNG